MSKYVNIGVLLKVGLMHIPYYNNSFHMKTKGVYMSAYYRFYTGRDSISSRVN